MALTSSLLPQSQVMLRSPTNAAGSSGASGGSSSRNFAISVRSPRLRPPPPRRRKTWTHCSASAADTQNATDTATRELEPELIEMTIADDQLPSSSSSASDASQASTSPSARGLRGLLRKLRVTPPRSKAVSTVDEDLLGGQRGQATPAALAAGSANAAALRARLGAAAPPPEVLARLEARSEGGKALRAELGIASAELRLKQNELGRAQLAMRTKDRQISELKAALAGRESRLRSAKAELQASRAALQEKDVELSGAYEKLTHASRERQQMRQQLISTQGELAATRADLEEWTSGLFELKHVMDSLDLESSTALAGPSDAEPTPPAASTAPSNNGTAPMKEDAKAGAKQQKEEAAVAVAAKEEKDKSSEVQQAAAAGPWQATMKFVSDLQELSAQMVADAREDEALFGRAMDLLKPHRPAPK